MCKVVRPYAQRTTSHFARLPLPHPLRPLVARITEGDLHVPEKTPASEEWAGPRITVNERRRHDHRRHEVRYDARPPPTPRRQEHCRGDEGGEDAARLRPRAEAPREARLVHEGRQTIHDGVMACVIRLNWQVRRTEDMPGAVASRSHVPAQRGTLSPTARMCVTPCGLKIHTYALAP